MNPAQVWTLVDEAKPPPGGAVVHSFTGKYLQVLPDNGDNYNEVHSYESFVSRDPPPPSLGGRLLGRQSKLIFYHSKLRALDLRVSPFVYY